VKIETAGSRVAFDTLREFITLAMTRLGLPVADAAIVGELMAQADLQGSDGHGVIRLAPYAKRIKSGGMNLNPKIKVVQERAGRYRAFSWSAVERILAAQAKPRSAMEALTIEAREQLDEMLRQIPLAPRSTAEYQTLLEETAEGEENHESEDNGPDDSIA